MTSVVEFEAGQGDWARRVRFASDDIELRPSAAAQIAVGLLPAMRRGTDLTVQGSIDPRLHRALDTIQDIQVAWVPNLRRVDVRCAVAESPARDALNNSIPFMVRYAHHERNQQVTVHAELVEGFVQSIPSAGSRVGCFFTGGVDSFYTLLKHQDVITDLIFVHGYDVSLDDLLLRQRVSNSVRQVAAACGKGVVEVETDVRVFLNPHVRWGAAHGAALAAIGHLVGGQFGRVYIASSYSYGDLFPWGSHPLLDPLWSDQAVEFIHDGCEARRHEKVGFIAEHEVALRHLRVCWQNPGGAYNCGRCDKCLRTMINLEIVGALSGCATFSDPLDPKRVAQMRMASETERVFAIQNLRALAERQPDSPVLTALRKAVRRAVWRERRQRVRRLILGKRLNDMLKRWI